MMADGAAFTNIIYKLFILNVCKSRRFAIQSICSVNHQNVKEMVYVGCKMPYACKSKGHATADIFRRLNAYV